jgi:predicted tellurium resistance membrane protein TerC
MEWLSDPNAWIALATLTALEIVLGIDNIIFIAILSGKLPPEQQAKGRNIGLLMAMLTRIALLFSLTWLMKLTAPLFSMAGHAFSGRDLILLGGGLFLIGKSTFEIHENLEGHGGHQEKGAVTATMGAVIFQIAILDIVFSLDSVITAIGLADEIQVMVIAVVIAVGVMLFLAGPISHFVERHPTFKILALSFLLLIGFALVGEGMGMHIPKAYMYFAMAFSVFVELLNMRFRKTRVEPVKLHAEQLDNPHP